MDKNPVTAEKNMDDLQIVNEGIEDVSQDAEIQINDMPEALKIEMDTPPDEPEECKDDNFKISEQIIDDNIKPPETYEEESMDIPKEGSDEVSQDKKEGKAKRRREAARIRRENFQYYKSIDYSGFIERLFARAVDFAIAVGFGYLVYKKLGLVPAILSIPLIDLFLRIVLTYFLGCTVGKFLFGVRVVSRRSLKLTIWQVLIREVSKYISTFFLNLGYVSIIVSRRKRAWHDMIACTAVTSGGRDEYQYAREVYKERPEKWGWMVSVPVSLILITGLALSLNKGASFVINNIGMVGFTKSFDTMPAEFRYKLPSASIGYPALNKEVVQLGDVDGDGGYEIFIEGVSGSKPFIKNLRFMGSRPIEGELGIVSDKNIIQYRMVDINGDERDELAVVGEDKVLSIYSLYQEAEEIEESEAVEEGQEDGKPEETQETEEPEKIEASKAPITYGPMQYKKITAVIKGKPSETLPERMYILGDKNKLTVISMNGTEVVDQKFDLPGSYDIASIAMGKFSDKNYLIALSQDGKLIFYNYDGKAYQESMTFEAPVKGASAIKVVDMNWDGEKEILVWAPKGEERPYPVLAAYKPVEGNMNLVWDGGRGYRFNSSEVALAFEDGMDMDGDKKFEAYMSTRRSAGQDGKFSIFAFEGNKYLFKINDILRAMAIKKPGQ